MSTVKSMAQGEGVVEFHSPSPLPCHNTIFVRCLIPNKEGRNGKETLVSIIGIHFNFIVTTGITNAFLINIKDQKMLFLNL